MRPDVISPAELAADTPPVLSDYGWRLLAEGDSWFSITATGRYSTNLLGELRLPRSTVAVNCAAPGHTLQRMVDRRADGRCERLLRDRRHARHWDAVLLSAGGNDLIAAAGTPLADAAGMPTPLARRLLRSVDEVRHARHATDWVSEAGWTVLADHLRLHFADFVGWRNQGPSAARPLLLHTYATPVARPSGAGLALQGWLYPTLLRYGVPAAWQQPVTELLFERLRRLLLGFDEASGGPDAMPGVHVFDSAGQVALTPAAPDDAGPSGDWINEIHLGPAGYRKLGRAFGAWAAAVLARYP
jgi:hypothetical protein